MNRTIIIGVDPGKVRQDISCIGFDPGLILSMPANPRVSPGANPKNLVTRTCAHCGKEFVIYRCTLKDGAGTCCCVSCNTARNNKNRMWRDSSKQKISQANKGRLKGEKNPNWQGGGLKFTCKNCGKIFLLGKWQLKKQKGIFCSIKCRGESFHKNRTPEYQKRINKNMGRAIVRCVKEKKMSRRWVDLVGYTSNDLIKHLESQFKDGMSWDNYGTGRGGYLQWHVDHIIPASSFSFVSYDDIGFKRCWALNNLQPLWAKENLRKWAHIEK